MHLGLGRERHFTPQTGDAHLGRSVQHRSRVARDPTQPNLRQVHLIHGELHDEGHLVRKAGVMAVVLIGGDVAPGDPIPTEMPAPPHRPLEPV